MEFPLWYVPFIIASVLTAVSYWKTPGRAKAIALIVAQFAVSLANAIVRQCVQVSELMKWYDPDKTPVRGEWGSFALFMVLLLTAIIIISWIGRVALHRTRSST